ncbi:ATP-binding protein [Streptomyces humicola]|uniref:ATP-binding protein n=1 Tax=Streptomyces humicola TaxID=2953240 RepID=UPI00210D8464|nr:ATP-binding protein [Streptomyces humicola]
MRRRPTAELLCTWTSCTPGAAARVRTALRHALDRRRIPGEVISDTVLAVSELAANASEHAEGPYELWLRPTAAELICEVHDRDPRMPDLPDFPAVTPFVPDPEHCGGGLEALCALMSERGRGLQIVDHLTGGHWGYRLTRNGKKKIAWVTVGM